MLKKYLDSLNELVDPRPLALFRIVFGAAILYQMVHYMGSGLIESGLLAPKMLFKYEGFGWVQPFGAGAMHLLLMLLALSAVALILGLYSRAAAAFFGVGFLYILLLEKSLFNNHLYLFCLLGILFAFMPADNAWSVGRFFSKKEQDEVRVPRWTILLLRAQFFIVYFYGGVAKLNPDWLLHQEPMRTVLRYFVERHPAFGFMGASAPVYLFTYGSLVFDLSIGFLLQWRQARWWALLGVLFFNVTNHFLFNDIGVFPFVMLCATLLFFPPEEVAAFLDKRGLRLNVQGKRKRSELPSHEPTGRWFPVRALIGAYMTFQLLFPLRWIFLPGNVDWTSVGLRFSWRMKSTVREVDTLKFLVTNDKGEHGEVGANTYLNTLQLEVLPRDPRMVIDFARFALADMKKRGLPADHIPTDIVVRFNGRQPQPLFPPGLDVAALRPESDPWEKWMPVLRENWAVARGQ